MFYILKNILLVLLLSFISLEASVDIKKSTELDNNISKERLEQKRQELILDYIAKFNTNEDILKKESIWEKSYSSYLTYIDVRKDLMKIKQKIKVLKRRRNSVKVKDEIATLLSKEKILSEQIELLKGHESTPFSSLIQPPELDALPSIKNPFDLFTAISYRKKVNAQLNDYIIKKESLQERVDLLEKKNKILSDLKAVDLGGDYDNELYFLSQKLEKFETALDTVNATQIVFEKRVEELNLQIKREMTEQLIRLFNLGLIIVFIVGFFFLVKLVVKKTITDNERFYMANKIITFANVSLIIIIILFNYIDNVSYLVTVLGFASAGIAIAMKDWFMSMLGWLVIVFGGSIHVGDRIRVDMEGIKYVGDVMDISLLRMTILEDITLTSIHQNRRAGRILFIPNNYVFTRMIANYSHDSLKTVWDGIDITISFDSDHKRAMYITKEIARKYSKGYTDITRKQLNKLRHKYSLKNTNVEPRIYSFIEPNGVNISTWYLTNAYATLTLRSVISTEIVDAFNNEDGITIAYPTQQLNITQNEKKVMPNGDSQV